MWKALCILLIAGSAHAQQTFHGKTAPTREEMIERVTRDFHRDPSVRNHVAELQMNYEALLQQGRPATRLVFEVTRECIEREVAEKTAAFKASKDASLRRSLAEEIKYLNAALNTYDIGHGAQPRTVQFQRNAK